MCIAHEADVPSLRPLSSRPKGKGVAFFLNVTAVPDAPLLQDPKILNGQPNYIQKERLNRQRSVHDEDFKYGYRTACQPDFYNPQLEA